MLGEDGKARRKAGRGFRESAVRKGWDGEVRKRARVGWSGQAGCQDGLGMWGRNLRWHWEAQAGQTEMGSSDSGELGWWEAGRVSKIDGRCKQTIGMAQE